MDSVGALVRAYLRIDGYFTVSRAGFTDNALEALSLLRDELPPCCRSHPLAQESEHLR